MLYFNKETKKGYPNKGTLFFSHIWTQIIPIGHFSGQ